MSSAEYTPIESLPPEQQEKITVLETKADELYGLRTQLVDFYRQNEDYLPLGKSGDRSDKMQLGEVVQALEEGKKLDDLIPWDKVDEKVDLKGVPVEEKEIAHQVHRDEVRANFEVAIEVYGQLKNSGGVFDSRGAATVDREAKEYYRMRSGEQYGVINQLNGIEVQTEVIETKLEYARNRLQENASAANLRLVDKYEEEYAQTFNRARELVEKSPEAYIYALSKQLRDAKETFDEHGRIVETPYVSAKLARVESILEDGRPAFIHGELGAGKTELAKHLARTELSQPYLERWQANNPPPSKEEKEAYWIWQTRKEQESEALVISGRKQIEPEQILAARSIKRGETPSPEEQIRIIEERWQAYSGRVLEEARQRGGEPEIQQVTSKLEGVDRPLFYSAYQEMFRSPIETSVSLAPLLQAMKEGRPLIIDEMNAIPHHVLIVMNDYLLRRTGEMVTPPFAEEVPFPIEKGFCVIATGNYKPEDGLMYIGRQPLDAAFLSRFGIVSYDYLPMQRELESVGATPEQQRVFRQQNELYHMLVTRMLNDDLSATLPEGSLQQIYKLAFVARLLQDVFSGREVDSAYYLHEGTANVKPQEVLKENVLSIRHLLPILDAWRNDGYRRSLDDYLFLEYVSRSDARPKEKLYIYQMLQQQDFFATGKGWPMADSGHLSEVLKYPIDQNMYKMDRLTDMRVVLPDRTAPLKTYSPKEVVENLFGPAPKRTVVPTDYLEMGKATTKPEVQQTEDDLERERLLASILENAKKLEEAGFPLTVGKQEEPE